MSSIEEWYPSYTAIAMIATKIAKMLHHFKINMSSIESKLSPIKKPCIEQVTKDRRSNSVENDVFFPIEYSELKDIPRDENCHSIGQADNKFEKSVNANGKSGINH